jgi:hypothetical protein
MLRQNQVSNTQKVCDAGKTRKLPCEPDADLEDGVQALAFEMLIQSLLYSILI